MSEPELGGEAVDEHGSVIERSSIRKNVAFMTSSQIITWVLSIAAAIIVPRFLGPEVLGEFQLASSLWNIAVVVIGLGTAVYLQLEIARDNRAGLSKMAPILVLRSMMFVIVSMALAVWVLFSGENQTFVIVMVLIGLNKLLVTWTEVFGTAFVGLERMATTAVVSAGIKLLSEVSVVLVLVLGFGVVGFVAIGVFTSLVGLLVMAWRFRTVSRLELAGAGRHLIPIAIGSVPFMMVALANATYRQIDVIVISRLAGARDLGWYGLADLLAGSLLFPATIVIAAVLPTMGRLHREDPDGLKDLVTRTFSMLLLIATPIGLGTALVAPAFAPTMFGDKYDGTGTVLVVIGPVLILTSGTTLLAYLAMATERKIFWVVLLFSAAALTIPLDMLLVPWATDEFDNGAIGGAIAYVVTETLQFAIGLVVVAPYLMTRSTGWRSLRVFMAGGLMFAAAWPFRNEFVVVPAVAGGAAYVIAVLVLRLLSDFERGLIGDVLAKVGVHTSWKR